MHGDLHEEELMQLDKGRIYLQLNLKDDQSLKHADAFIYDNMLDYVENGQTEKQPLMRQLLALNDLKNFDEEMRLAEESDDSLLDSNDSLLFDSEDDSEDEAEMNRAMAEM